jgi:hypothetical protein
MFASMLWHPAALSLQHAFYSTGLPAALKTLQKLPGKASEY